MIVPFLYKVLGLNIFPILYNDSIAIFFCKPLWPPFGNHLTPKTTKPRFKSLFHFCSLMILDINNNILKNLLWGIIYDILFTMYLTHPKYLFYLPSSLTSELRMITNAPSFRYGMNPQIFLFSLYPLKYRFFLRWVCFWYLGPKLCHSSLKGIWKEL